MQQSLKINNVCGRSWAEQLAQLLISTQGHTHTHTSSGISKSPCWPACGYWSVWPRYKSAASWTEGHWRPASVDGGRRGGLRLLWRLWLRFKTHTLRHTQQATQTQTTQDFKHSYTHCEHSHTPLLFPLNTVWWSSILLLGFSSCAEWVKADNRADPKRRSSQQQPAGRLNKLPKSCITQIIKLRVGVMKARSEVSEANVWDASWEHTGEVNQAAAAAARNIVLRIRIFRVQFRVLRNAGRQTRLTSCCFSSRSRQLGLQYRFKKKA